MIDRLDGFDYTFMAFCVWRHHLAYLARKAVSSVATIHEPISN
jgi:hypothetical protein